MENKYDILEVANWFLQRQNIQLWIFLCSVLYLFASLLRLFNIWLILFSNCSIFRVTCGFVNNIMNKKRNLT